jgi:hypothetical protein
MERTWDLIRGLGGPKAVAEACGVTISAVGSWQVTGSIPARHWITLWRLAKARGLDWRPPGAEDLDLIERPPPAPRTAAAAAREEAAA